jgi:HSP20 family protein
MRSAADHRRQGAARDRRRAQPRASRRRESQNVYAQERFAGSFRRVISLPDDADPAKVDASLRDGLLRISVAKRESSKPRQIAVS